MVSKTVFFDLETGGLDPARHAIIQIAAIAIDATYAEAETFEVKIKFRPENAEHDALSVNSYDAEVWEREAISPVEACARFSRFLSSHATVCMKSRKGSDYYVAQLAGHNAAAFDGPFIQAWYKRLNAFLPASYRVLCTMQRAMWMFHGSDAARCPRDYKLETLCRHFGISIDGAHDALGDVRATVRLSRALHEAAAKAGAA